MQDLYLTVQGLGYPIQCGVGLKIDVNAGSIPEAVDSSKYYAELILGMFCFSAKTFIDAPREQFCVDSDPSSDEHEFVQYHYFPDYLPSDSTELRGENVTELVEGFSKGTQRQFERITRAISWYRVCLQKFDLIERFTSLWLGLESINPLLYEMYDCEAEKRVCRKCGHTSEQKTTAGIKAAFDRSGRTEVYRKARDVRVQLMHGTENLGVVTGRIATIISDVEEQLAESVCFVAGISRQAYTPSSGSRPSLLPPILIFQGKLGRFPLDELEGVDQLLPLDPSRLSLTHDIEGQSQKLTVGIRLPFSYGKLHLHKIGTAGGWSSSIEIADLFVNGRLARSGERLSFD